MKAMKLYLKYRDDIKIAVEFGLLAMLLATAYNVGHYDSLQYQKWYDECRYQSLDIDPNNITFWDDNINISSIHK